MSKKNPPPPTRRTLAAATSRLLKLGDDLSRVGELEATLQAVTRVALRLTRSLQGSLRLLDDTGSRLLTSARSGPSVHRRMAAPFRPDEGFLGWVVTQRKSAYTNNPAKDSRFVIRGGQRWTPSAILAVPLLAGRQCIGVLSVSRNDKKPYRELDLDLLRLVARLSEPHLEIARLKRLNESDALTLLHNRRHLMHRLPAEIQRARRARRPLAVAMMDLDRFKLVNDTHGHDVGDEVLAAVADRMRRVSRGSDVVCRWGGEEFLAIFPETDLKSASRIAERIRESVGDAPISTAAGALVVTVSIGVATLARDDDEHTVVKRADKNLYAAKRGGRNRVVTRS